MSNLTLDLPVADKSYGQARIQDIERHLDRIFGKDAWVYWEPETIAIELGFIPDQLLQDKISVLQLIKKDNSLFYTDPMFFLFATEVINDNPVDFETIPMPSAMELAYAVHQFPGPFNDDIKEIVTYLVADEGYSEAPDYLKDLVIASKLPPNFGTEEDQDNKNAAVLHYVDLKSGVHHG